jgi:hypothetical protein
LVLAAPRPEAVGETEEVRLVDGVFCSPFGRGLS